MKSLSIVVAIAAVLLSAPVHGVAEDAPLPQDPSDLGDDGDSLAEPDLGIFRAEDPEFRSYIPDLGDIPEFITGLIEQPRGFFTKGKLVNASALPPDGPGFVKLFPSRDRAWGSLDVVSMVQSSAFRISQAYPGSERLQVGDLANKAGGRAGGHSSHQNGLDVDVVYYRVNRAEDLDVTTFPESFVSGGKVTSNFDTARNWALFKDLVATRRVNRIFVDQAIKKEFCRYAKEQGEFEAQTDTLRRLRPWRLHDDHFHLRITCPAKSPACENQDPPSSGSGCRSLARSL